MSRLVGELKLTHTPTAQGAVPDNARGMGASKNYWMLREADRVKYALGWWHEYDRKPSTSREFAYMLGRQESRVAHSFAAQQAAR